MTLVTAYGVCLLLWLRHTECAVTAYGVCLLLWLRHTECAYYFGYGVWSSAYFGYGIYYFMKKVV